MACTLAGAVYVEADIKGVDAVRYFGENLRLVHVFAFISIVFWTYYAFIQVVFSPLSVDEVYFAHIFWLRAQGLHQYVDFYSAHLPAYFWLFGPLAGSGNPPEDLSFVWRLRALTGVIIFLYALVLFRADRRLFVPLLPVMLILLVNARMLEIRTDTVGLLLFNAAWGQLIVDTRRKQILSAAFLAALSLLFSARAAVMLPAMGALMAGILFARRDGRTFNILLGMVAAALLIAFALFLADSSEFLLIVKSAYLSPLQLMPHVSMHTRFLASDRVAVVIAILAALGGATGTWARDRTTTRALVVLCACAAQLLLIACDPSPFLYVYGWSLIPTLFGIAMIFPLLRWNPLGGLVFASVAAATTLVIGSATYVTLKGRQPFSTSRFRLMLDRPTDPALIQSLPIATLIDLQTSRFGVDNLSTYLLIRSEICRRIDGRVIANFSQHPICLHDSSYDWMGLTGSPFRQAGRTVGPITRRQKHAFDLLFASNPPALVIHNVKQLGPWARSLLSEYVIYPNYAIRKDVVARDASHQTGTGTGSLRR